MSARKRTISRVYTSSTQPVPSVKRTKPTRKTTMKKSNMVSGLGNKNVLMPFHYERVTSSNTQVVHHNVIRGNGLFDPDYELGGEKPLGYDQYAALYKKYYVKSAKVTADFYALAETGIMPNDMLCYVWADTDETAPTTHKGVVERCAAKHGRSLRPPNVYAGQTPSRLTLKYHTKAVTDHGFEDETLSGEVTALPIQEWYIHLAWLSQNVLPAQARTVLENALVIYEVVFYDAQPLPSS